MTYYVYALIDPRDGQPFYIGKGKGNRSEAHEKEARAGKRSRKCDRIRNIWADGKEVGRRIVETFDDEDAAFDREISMIASIGLEQLTNVLPGGQGKSCPRMTPDQIIARLKERRLAPKIKAIAERFVLDAVFPLERDGRELGRAFMSALRAIINGDDPPGWKIEAPRPYTVLGMTLQGPDPLQVLLELANDARCQRGTRMDAVNTLSQYCRPVSKVASR